MMYRQLSLSTITIFKDGDFVERSVWDIIHKEKEIARWYSYEKRRYKKPDEKEENTDKNWKINRLKQLVESKNHQELFSF